jgi:class 3 adenylate cyclase
MIKTNVASVKSIEFSLPYFEKDTELYDLVDSFLEKCIHVEEVREDIEFVYNLIDKLRQYKETDNQVDTVLNMRKRLIRFLLRLPQYKSQSRLKNAQSVTITRVNHMSQIDTTIPVYANDDYYALLVESQINVEQLRSNNEVLSFKRKKALELSEICESLALFTSRNLSIDQVVTQKLQQILDGFVMQYGGVAFCSPVNISQNSALGTEIHEDSSRGEKEFLDHVYSTSTLVHYETMKKKGLSPPKLTKCHLFNQILLSKQFKFLKPELINVPNSHFDIQNVLAIPIVINKVSVALICLANGKYDKLDAEVMFDILPNLWQNVVLGSIERENKAAEGITRLKNIEKRLEQGAKMTISLNNIWEQDDVEIENLSRRRMLKIKLKDMANFLEREYGGIVFAAPTFASINANFFLLRDEQSSSGSESDTSGMEDEYKFMAFILSDGAKVIKESVMLGMKTPVMKKTKLMVKCTKEKKPYLLDDATQLNLPPKHFPLNTLLLVPIVVNNSTVCLVGLANGTRKYTEIDGNVLQDVLSTSWLALLQESFARIDLKFKENLLNQTLPDFMVKRIKQTQSTNVAVQYEKVSILFSDFVNFTTFSKNLAPTILVEFLNTIFTRFDNLAKLNKVEKIKTIGDGYMAAAGVSEEQGTDHALACCNFALGMCEEVDKFNHESGHHEEIKKRLPIQVRVGVATGGPIIAGIIGSTKLQYDLWGETVNLSSRMESSGVPGKVQISEETYESVKDRFETAERGTITVKGMGQVKTFLLVKKK